MTATRYTTLAELRKAPAYLVRADFGIEVEVEGRNLHPGPILGWRKEEDPSLRGESAEYVLIQPLPLLEAQSALLGLHEALKVRGSIIKQSPRAGIHLHLNVLGLTWSEIVATAFCFYLVEKRLIKHAGPSRVGNLFCLSLEDAEYPLRRIEEAIVGNNIANLADEDIRYAALNWNALYKYGSLEFRYLPTEPDFCLLTAMHMNALLNIRNAGVYFKTPRRVIEAFSAIGPRSVIQTILGSSYEGFYQEFGRKEEAETLDAVRRIQDLAYVTNWDNAVFPNGAGGKNKKEGPDLAGLARAFADLRREPGDFGRMEPFPNPADFPIGGPVDFEEDEEEEEEEN